MKHLRHIVSVGLLIALVASASAQSWLTNGLVAYYPFNGNANDESGNGNGGAVNGAILAPDRFGGAYNSYDFNGSSSVITASSQSYLNLANTDFTISLWATRTATQPTSFILGKDLGNGRYPNTKWTLILGPYVNSSVSTLTFHFIGQDAVGHWEGSVAIKDEFYVWHHYSVTRAGAQFSIYQDGALLEVVTDPSPLSDLNPAPLTIGNSENGGWHQGHLDDIRIYNRALSSNEVAQLYALEAPVPPTFTLQPQSFTAVAGSSTNLSVTATGSDVLSYQWMKDGLALPGATNSTLVFSNIQPVNIGDYVAVVSNGGGSVTSSVASVSIPGVNSGVWQGLVAYYPFNGNANDETGFGNDGTLHGPSLGSDRLGVHASSYFFSGEGSPDNIEITKTNILDSANFTVSLWFNAAAFPTDSPASYAMFLISRGRNDVELHLGCPPFQSKGIRFLPRLLNPTTAQAVDVRSAVSYQTNFWYQLVATYEKEGSHSRLFLNGNELEQTAYTGGDGPPDIRSIKIGMRYNAIPGQGLPFKGSIDDIRIYNRALSSNEVAQLYALEAPVPPTFTLQPQSVTAAAGSSTNLSVTATGSQLLTYQWLKDGVALPGATNASLLFSNLQPVNVGDYAAVVSNGGGSLTSSVASVSIPGLNSGLWQGLVAYYPFNGNANDESGNGNDGNATALAFSGDRFGESSKAGEFNGTSSYVEIPSLTTFQYLPLTYSVWIKTSDYLPPVSYINQARIIMGRVQACDASCGALSLYSEPRYGINDILGYYTGAEFLSSQTRPNLSSWMQLVLTIDINNRGAFYLNGNLVSSQQLVQLSTSFYPIRIGHGTPSVCSPSPDDFWKGGLDDVRIYNRALSSNEVAQLYALEFPDADKDGLSDYEEINVLHTNPNKRDTDDDGLSDYEEVRVRLTNPIVADTDGDGFNDYAEIYTAHDPLLNTDYPAANLSAFTAIELEFVTKVGTTYQLQTSPDLVTWTNFDTAIIGDGNVWKKTYSTRSAPRLYHRVESVP